MIQLLSVLSLLPVPIITAGRLIYARRVLALGVNDRASSGRVRSAKGGVLHALSDLMSALLKDLGDDVDVLGSTEYGVKLLVGGFAEDALRALA